MDKFSFFNSAHSAFFEEIYESFLKDPDSVEPSWRSFFQGYQFGFENYNGTVVFDHHCSAHHFFYRALAGTSRGGGRQYDRDTLRLDAEPGVLLHIFIRGDAFSAGQQL